MKKYLTVGTDEIRRDLFLPVSDKNAHSDIKPSGGLWLTSYDTSIPNFNHWVDYMLRNPYVLFYKNRGKNPFKQPCCVIVLKKEANIYKLNSVESYKFLLDNFSDDKGFFSYESVSNKFDGLFIDLSNLRYVADMDLRKKFLQLGVSSLVLFNIDAIDYYYSGVVNIDPFEYDYIIDRNSITYDIKWNSERKYITDGLEKTSRKR